ncbi:uncharacterized protein TRIREDRAFT_110224 [Trichoderma reesei QM6a]|uniref:Predicted protein n=2 Tax=Hypocrea jecorina TaxID=51453 RepID=G0RRI9_HYPJQ|nr:uncharacterized protein TRIREDRAFT_110224 [Trichoderma reesei QM6a]EGR46250.1 predicted protein [Trichoderma reesei QM6a]ETR99304.1 hypothetical protein M419DRAFT_86792 [Trichoderma reesei RUT C-30]
MEAFNDTDNVWPDDVQPPSPSPSPSPSLSSAPPSSATSTESIPWEDLQAFEDEALALNTAVLRQTLYGHLYAHLPNEQIDWDLEGENVCRVIGARCYGIILALRGLLIVHLGNHYHLDRNASLALRDSTSSPAFQGNSDIVAAAPMLSNESPDIQNQASGNTGDMALETPES